MAPGSSAYANGIPQFMGTSLLKSLQIESSFNAVCCLLLTLLLAVSLLPIPCQPGVVRPVTSELSLRYIRSSSSTNTKTQPSSVTTSNTTSLASKSESVSVAQEPSNSTTPFQKAQTLIFPRGNCNL